MFLICHLWQGAFLFDYGNLCIVDLMSLLFTNVQDNLDILVSVYSNSFNSHMRFTLYFPVQPVDPCEFS